MLSNKIIYNSKINNELKNCYLQLIKRYYTSNNNNNNNKKIKTGILMLNLGGPSNLNEVEPFLTRLFTDKEIFKLPFQQYTGTLIAKRRAPTVRKLYASIGGGSPIRKWTDLQGEKLSKLLDEISPETAPHKHYIGFRYSDPLIADTLDEMKNDDVERVIAFSQYPQFSCTTTGSSLNNLWKTLEEKDMKGHFKWSIIDRWQNHEGFIKATTHKVEKAIKQYYNKLNEQNSGNSSSGSNNNDKPVLVFSAHSLPMSTVEKGDPYPQEVSETVCKVMESLGKDKYEYMLAWQSKVGPLPWLSPKTSFVIDQLAKNKRNAIVIPIAFTSDHIETLSEIDIELQEHAKKAGMKLLVRSEALNDDPLIISAMADLVKSHLSSNNSIHSKQYHLKCPGCKQDSIYCRQILNPIEQL
ncbi:ferrochelatase [Dictyostelium purpureum]|uniref:Ferrochelatase n=1 Tax=Dictyostelium purpureum TaxID=5786 RepID=F0ZES6_DICPU|nr:ferrochelatase [Dictyostelium purpureum]EGC37545.1 ferrochelatase [Dictyostelium purpureum]|eukprot:XP_003285936.1 ferrochelatase [Dictyostelium purpureum]